MLLDGSPFAEDYTPIRGVSATGCPVERAGVLWGAILLSKRLQVRTCVQTPWGVQIGANLVVLPSSKICCTIHADNPVRSFKSQNRKQGDYR